MRWFSSALAHNLAGNKKEKAPILSGAFSVGRELFSVAGLAALAVCALGLGVGFGHVSSGLCLAIERISVAVIHVALGIDPD